MTRPNFRIYFNNRKQWFDVYIADNKRKFVKTNDCYAYYQPAERRLSRRGYFGSVHLSDVGGGLVSHELMHLWLDWIRSRKPGVVTEKNEERLVSEFGEINRKFWVAWYRHQG